MLLAATGGEAIFAVVSIQTLETGSLGGLQSLKEADLGNRLAGPGGAVVQHARLLTVLGYFYPTASLYGI